MSFLKNIFNSSPDDSSSSKLNWNQLINLDQLDEISNLSFEKPIVILKHSTRGSISRMVLKQFENQFDIETDLMELYFLDLLAHRDVSNAIADRFEVLHQSPQIIVVKEGKSVFNASHESIEAEDLKRFV
jgi:bacillithiol system protein YtxJ